MKFIILWLFSALTFLLFLLCVFLASKGHTGWFTIVVLSFLVGTALTRLVEESL